MKLDFSPLMDVPGFLGASLADSDTGMLMAATENPPLDLEVAAAANTEVVRAKRKALTMLGFNEQIEDLMISLDTQYHILRILERHPSLYLYCALARDRANIALARMAMKKMVRTLDDELS